MTKNNKRLIGFFLLLSIFLLLILFNIKMPCPFKKTFHIACPSCGLTRSILALIQCNIKMSIYYNILGIPIFFTFLITYLFLIHDIIKRKNYLTSFWLFLCKHYKIIVFLLIISCFLNNIHKV